MVSIANWTWLLEISWLVFSDVFVFSILMAKNWVTRLIRNDFSKKMTTWWNCGSAWKWGTLQMAVFDVFPADLTPKTMVFDESSTSIQPGPGPTWVSWWPRLRCWQRSSNGWARGPKTQEVMCRPKWLENEDIMGRYTGNWLLPDPFVEATKDWTFEDWG